MGLQLMIGGDDSLAWLLIRIFFTNNMINEHGRQKRKLEFLEIFKILNFKKICT